MCRLVFCRYKHSKHDRLRSKIVTYVGQAYEQGLRVQSHVINTAARPTTPNHRLCGVAPELWYGDCTALNGAQKIDCKKCHFITSATQHRVSFMSFYYVFLGLAYRAEPLTDFDHSRSIRARTVIFTILKNPRILWKIIFVNIGRLRYVGLIAKRNVTFTLSCCNHLASLQRLSKHFAKH